MKRCLALLLLALPFSGLAADWRTEADVRIERLRKGDFSLTVQLPAGVPLEGVQVSYQLKRHAFLFGTAISYQAFSDRGADGRAYRQFILDNFSALVCENEMKWYRTERSPRNFNYAPADELLEFAEKNGLQMRGHTLFWDDPTYIMPWLKRLSRSELRSAVQQHLTDIVTHYRGRIAYWDVNNEMLTGGFFRGELGPEIAPWMFREAARLDPKPTLFVNEYGIIGVPEQIERYLALIRELQAQGAPVGGIGVQSHDTDRFTEDPKTKPPKLIIAKRPSFMLTIPVTPAIFMDSLDRLSAATHLPIHLTEITANNADPEERADSLEMIFRLGFSHEAVEAMLLWGFAAKSHFLGSTAALMDSDNTLNAAGRRISRLLREEWTTRGSATLDAQGRTTLRGFYGVYIVTVKFPDGRIVVREVNLTRATPNALLAVTP